MWVNADLWPLPSHSKHVSWNLQQAYAWPLASSSFQRVIPKHLCTDQFLFSSYHPPQRHEVKRTQMDPNYDLLFAVPDTDKNKDSHEDSACIDERYTKSKNSDDIVKCGWPKKRWVDLDWFRYRYGYEPYNDCATLIKAQGDVIRAATNIDKLWAVLPESSNSNYHLTKG